MITLKSWPNGQDFCFMNPLIRLYRLINALSIDVALGAVCSAAWFAKGFDVQLRPYAFLALGLTVWIIYTADHLLDARKVAKEASTYRHRFHQQYFKILAVCLMIAVVIDFGFIFFVRVQILYAGLTLFSIVVLYLLVNRWLSFVKELVIAIVYCSGVLLPTLSLKSTGLSAGDYLWIVSFFLTALINLMVFSIYDFPSDKSDGYNSFVRTFGVRLTQQILSVFFLVQVGLAGMLAVHGFWNEATVLSVMNITLFLLFIKPSYFAKADLYRVVGDGVFLFPVVLLLVG